MSASLANPTETLVRGFSSPLDHWDSDLVEAWLIIRARRRASDFASSLRARGTVDPGLPDVLDKAAAQLGTLADYWHPATGILLKHRRFHARTERQAAELALFWHERGVPGLWQLSADPGEGQAHSHFAGYSLGGLAAGLESDGKRCLIETGRGTLHQFRFEQGRWTCDTARRVRIHCDARIASEQWPLRSRCDDQDRGMPATAEYAAAIRNALRLVARQSPRHFDWVARLLTIVLPLEREGRAIRSWSSGDYPGLVSLCGNGDPLEVVETLVHEASHQHFHAACQFGDLVDPDSDEAAWSPVKQCPRPIEMILLSYHAFANVQLYFRLLAGSGLVAADSYVSHCATLLEWRPVLEEALARSRTITPLGHLLWRNLSYRLDSNL